MKITLVLLVLVGTVIVKTDGSSQLYYLPQVFLATKHGVEAKNYENLGDAAKLGLTELVQSQPGVFSSSGARLTPSRGRRMSSDSVQSGMFETQQARTMTELSRLWWGSKRIGEAQTPRSTRVFITDYIIRLRRVLP